MMKRIAATLLCAVAPAALMAQQVDLRSPDEFISVEGQIVGFNGVMLRVETSVGTVSVPASEVICYGVGCLTTLQNNDFGLTAEALAGVVLSPTSATPDTGTTTPSAAAPAPATLGNDLSIAFASPAFQAFYSSIAGAFGAEVTGSSVALDGGVRLASTPDASAADIVVGTVDLHTPAAAAFDTIEGWLGSDAALTHQMIGLNAFTVQIAPSAGIDSISMDDLARVYAGEITNWSQIGGNDLAVLALRLPDTSPVHQELLAVLMSPRGLSTANGVLAMGDEGGITASVNQFPGSISVVSSGAANPDLTIPVAGSCDVAVAPTDFNILSGDYPLVRPVMATYGGAANAPLAAFFDFAASDAAQQIGATFGMRNFSATRQDTLTKSARLSGLLNATLDDNQRAAAAEMFQTLFNAERFSTTLIGGAVSGQEAAWNRAMMVDLAEAIGASENAGREVIFVGISESDAGSAEAIAASGRIAAQMRDAFQAFAAGAISDSGVTLSSYGFGDVAKATCLESQASGSLAARVEVWIR